MCIIYFVTILSMVHLVRANVMFASRSAHNLFPVEIFGANWRHVSNCKSVIIADILESNNMNGIMLMSINQYKPVYRSELFSFPLRNLFLQH